MLIISSFFLSLLLSLPVRNVNALPIDLDKHNFLSVKLLIFSYITYVLGAQKNRLIETVLLSTYNICFS